MSFCVIPAIDIRRGRAVRLSQGRFDRETAYDADPRVTGEDFRRQGARRIHVVDLDGARLGRPQAGEVIQRLAALEGCEIQAGGGIRDAETADRYLKWGAKRIVCGSKVCLDKGFLKEMLGAFGEAIIAAADARNGRIATDGWTRMTAVRTDDFIESVLAAGGREIIFTDIAKDGMLEGPNVAEIKRLAAAYPARFIASGGVSSLDDIRALKSVGSERLIGVIVGKALYEGKIDLKEAIKLGD